MLLIMGQGRLYILKLRLVLRDRDVIYKSFSQLIRFIKENYWGQDVQSLIGFNEYF